MLKIAYLLKKLALEPRLPCPCLVLSDCLSLSVFNLLLFLPFLFLECYTTYKPSLLVDLSFPVILLQTCNMHSTHNMFRYYTLFTMFFTIHTNFAIFNF